MAKSGVTATRNDVDGVVHVLEASEPAAFSLILVLSLAWKLILRGDLVLAHLLEQLVGLKKVDHSLAKVDFHSQAFCYPIGVWSDGVYELFLLASRGLFVLLFSVLVIASCC